MNKHSNSDLLSVGSKLKTKKSKSKNVSVIFDEKSRTYFFKLFLFCCINLYLREYLTGFQKRNKEKKKKYLEKQRDILHQEKVEKRREVYFNDRLLLYFF